MVDNKTQECRTHHPHQLPSGGLYRLAASVTAHCLLGCVIGESIGLLLGVSLGWHPLQTAVVATLLAFISGFSLTLIPTARRGMNVKETFRTVWRGEVISIGVMELVMNVVDYQVGGMTADSVADPIFWIGLVTAIGAGYAAGYPVNYLMLKHGIKEKCH